MEQNWDDIKVGDLVSFDYSGYGEKIYAVVLEVVPFPYDNPVVVFYLYVYAIKEKGYTFIEFGEVENLEVL